VKLGTLTLFSCLLVSCVMHASAADSPSRAERLAWRDATDYLQLSAAQLDGMAATRSEYLPIRMHWVAEAAKLAGAAAGPSGVGEALARVCSQAQAADAEFRTKLRSRLNEKQLELLGRLEQAFALMAVIESAQSAGLMTDRLGIPPAGMPTGSVAVETSWRRFGAAPLPGCDSTVVHREVSSDDKPKGKSPGK
jgi:hypothetical protein